MATTLLRNATGMITGLAGTAARAAGPDLRIEGERIAAIGRLEPLPGETVLDATDCVVYPGWVNTHHHLFQSLLKGIPAGINLQLVPWLNAVPVAYRRFAREDTLRTAARIGMAELVLSGCTTIADHHYAYWPGMPFDASALLFEVAAEFGVRFVLLRGGATKVRDTDIHPPPQAAPETLDGMLASVERDVQRFHQRGGDAMRKVVLAPTTPTWSVPEPELKAFARAARRMGIGLHSHMSESLDYVTYCRDVHGCWPIEFCERHEWLGRDVFHAHLVHLQPHEIRMLADSGTGMSHCPQSNCRLGSGIAPAPALDAMGGRVSIGVDGAASNEAADMVSEVHAAWLVHRARDGAASTSVEGVVRWGTAGGADLLGLGEVGTLEVGKQADIAVYSLDELRYAGLHDPLIGPVAAGGAARLKHLFCAGRSIVRDGEIPGFNRGALLQAARVQVQRMVGH
ncbi:MAG: amidohydrolase family protein [Burkholderiales bacterium]|nr:amidohydrolase family protein [Burkholderiales bacterium]